VAQFLHIYYRRASGWNFHSSATISYASGEFYCKMPVFYFSKKMNKFLDVAQLIQYRERPMLTTIDKSSPLVKDLTTVTPGEVISVTPGEVISVTSTSPVIQVPHSSEPDDTLLSEREMGSTDSDSAIAKNKISSSASAFKALMVKISVDLKAAFARLGDVLGKLPGCCDQEDAATEGEGGSEGVGPEKVAELTALEPSILRNIEIFNSVVNHGMSVLETSTANEVGEELHLVPAATLALLASYAQVVAIEECKCDFLLATKADQKEVTEAAAQLRTSQEGLNKQCGETNHALTKFAEVVTSTVSAQLSKKSCELLQQVADTANPIKHGNSSAGAKKQQHTLLKNVDCITNGIREIVADSMQETVEILEKIQHNIEA
jgi:hypothetical protein